VFDWFSADVHGPWLMILDNADDLEVLFQSLEPSSPVSTLNVPLADSIPRAQRGSILVTTRDKRVGQRLIDRQAPIILLPMDLNEAKDLLNSQLQPEAGCENHDILGLLEALEYLPLAITQAVAFINENSTTISGYLDLLGADDVEIEALLDEDHGDHRRDFESASSVIRTWKLSFDLISKQKPLAARTLSLMAVLDRQGIPKSLVKGDDDSDLDITTALGALQAFFLVHVGKGGETYELHRLVQLATRRWLEWNGIKEEMQRDAMFLIANRFPNGNFETWTECEKLVPHASKVVQYNYTDEACKLRYALLLRNMAHYESSQGRYDIAFTRGTAALELQEKLLGSEDQETLATMRIVGRTIHDLGRWKDAEKLNSRLVEITKRVLGPEDHFTLQSIMDRGTNLERMCCYSDAEELLVSVAKTYRRLNGLEDIDTANAMERVSAVYLSQSRYKEAEELAIHVLATRKRMLGPQHPSTSASMSYIAALHEHQGRYEDAEKLFLDVLQTTREKFPAEHTHVIRSRANLARLYARQGRLQEAEELLLSVLEVRKKMSGTEHPETLQTMHNLACTYELLGDSKAAQTLYEDVFVCQKRVLGPEHGDTLKTMKSLAFIYKDQGRDYEAIDLVQAVVEGRIKILGADSPDTLSSKHNLAFLYERQGRLDEAKALYEEVLECRKRVLGAQHRETLTTMSYLAFIYQEQDRHDEAIELMQDAVKGRIETLGADHEYTLGSIDCLKDWTKARTRARHRTR
jgi:tetratricopeptide (TPR) repeat protein